MSNPFDFNHGSQLPADDPRAHDISSRINAHIDAAFAVERNEQARRDYIGASAIGNECLRALQFGYTGITIDEGRIDGQKLRIFRAGHVWEEELGNWLRMAGFALDTANPETGKQWGFAVLGGRGKGHLDGILRAGPIPLEYPCLWECKALNRKGWQEVKKNGLSLAKPIYAAQVAIDQAYLKLTVPAVFSVLNKDTEELHHELVPFDRELAQRSSDKMVQVVTATESKVLLPRAHADSSHYLCQWCDWRKTCWSLKR